MFAKLIGPLGSALFLLVFTLLGSTAVEAQCQDCNKRCCKWRICEPVCKSSCEASREVCLRTGAQVRIPTPQHPVTEVERALQQSCAAAFQIINNAVILYQGPYAAGSENLLDDAKSLLIRAGITG